jgi:transposase-like protein
MTQKKPVYSEEFRKRTIEHIIESGTSVTKAAKDFGIGSSTLSKWLKTYRDRYEIPSNYTQRGKKPEKTTEELNNRIKELEKLAKKQEKEIKDRDETVEILKKSLHIFMRPQE